MLAAAILLLGASAAAAQSGEAKGEPTEEQEKEGPVIPLGERFRPFYEGRVFRLKVNLHQPEQGGKPAPWISGKCRAGCRSTMVRMIPGDDFIGRCL